MELVVLVVMLALLQFIYFSVRVADARGRYGVKAPATSGHPAFERLLRIQANTHEQLVVFIPAAFSYAYLADQLGWYGSQTAAFLGVVYLIGRAIYARAYLQDPATRTIGFVLSFAPSALLIAGAVIAVIATVI